MFLKNQWLNYNNNNNNQHHYYKDRMLKQIKKITNLLKQFAKILIFLANKNNNWFKVF